MGRVLKKNDSVQAGRAAWHRSRASSNASPFPRLQTFVWSRQEDAHEFLLAVLDAVERDTKKGILCMGGSKVGCRVISFVQQNVW